MSDHESHAKAPEVHGLLAEFDREEDLMDAVHAAYHADYRHMDAYSPFPLHGLAEAMGVRKTWVPFFTLIGGLSGALLGFGMQYFAMVIHTPYDIGGKPLNSWPSFIPITFEMAILIGAISALGSMLLLNGLPQPYHPVFNGKRFERASNDGFFLCIEERDGQYDPTETRKFLEAQRPVEVSEVRESPEFA